MRKQQLIVIVVAIASLVCLYTFGSTIPDKKEASAGMKTGAGPASAATGNNVQAADFSDILSKAKQKLPAETAVYITGIENSVIRGDVQKQHIDTYHKLAAIWDSLHYMPIAAHYAGEAAKLENSKNSLTFAAGLFLDDLQHTDDAAVHKWEANQANELLQKAIALDPDNDSLKVALANTYVEGGDIMQGVQQLLAITRKDPDNEAANVMLGRLSVVSGQLNKAIARLTKVVQQHPDNTEALYFLAEAYKSSGNKEKAIELFTRCKQLVNNPEFSKEIDKYINSFK